MKRILSVTLALMLCLSLFVFPTRAQEEGPTKAEIYEAWLAVTSAEKQFVTEPSVNAPYAAGELSKDFLQSGISCLNYVRTVAGLPAVELDDALNEEAQHGTVVLAAIDQLTHYPTQPADMSDAFFDKGYSATEFGVNSRCNRAQIVTFLYRTFA